MTYVGIMVIVKIATVSELWSCRNYDLEQQLWLSANYRPFQNYDPVKIMTWNSNYGYRQNTDHSRIKVPSKLWLRTAIMVIGEIATFQILRCVSLAPKTGNLHGFWSTDESKPSAGRQTQNSLRFQGQRISSWSGLNQALANRRKILHGFRGTGRNPALAK